jgi:TonB family protein
VKTDEYDHANEDSNLPSPYRDFTLTLLADAHLSHRLWKELHFALNRLKHQWPRFRENPLQFTRNATSQYIKAAQHAVGRPSMAAGLLVSIVLIATLVIAVAILERHSPKRTGEDDNGDLALITTFDLATDNSAAHDRGVGAGANGRVGFARGAGEGSRPQPARSHGGGGGGTRAQSPASQGRPPLPSIIPAPIPTTAVKLPQALPLAGIDLDPALWRKLDYSTYGDPRSKSTASSNGSGDGGGVGTGNGTGIGEGDGAGFGPGQRGNKGGEEKSPGSGGGGGGPGCRPTSLSRGCIGGEQVFNGRDVATRARVISKPEPTYTEQARRNQVTGTVVLRVVFSSSGEVTNIQPVQKLSDGLTEKAITAAKQIRFVPATREGRPVSMYMQLEYNFNLY